METPLENISNGHLFQQIVAEYFRCLKEERHEYHIADIKVEDNGVGGDDGCDILVEFHYEDTISRHTKRWVIECKCWTKAVGPNDINLGRIPIILKANRASGYLLICKNDATASLKRDFRRISENPEEIEHLIWNGSFLWRKFANREGLLKAFFPEFYKEKYIDTKDKENFEVLYAKFIEQLKK